MLIIRSYSFNKNVFFPKYHPLNNFGTYFIYLFFTLQYILTYCINNQIQIFDDMQNFNHVRPLGWQQTFCLYLLEDYLTLCSYKVEDQDMQLCGLA